MDNLDWSLIRSFLAVADTGSLSAAARVTGISQPTLGRHLRSLEHSLGTALFQRTATGQSLTDTGRDLLPMAQSMRDAAARLHLVASARRPGLSGTVRLTASRAVAHHLLPPILADLQRAEPGIQIDLVPSDSSENLLFSEADIALRMYRPSQPDLVATHLADLPLRLYAAKSLLARLGTPQTTDDLLALPFVGFDRSDLILQLMASMGFPRRREDFPIRCDDQLVYWNLVRAGLGLGAAQSLIGDADPLVQAVDLPLALPSLPLWLVTAAPLAQSPRLRRVWDHLATALRDRSPKHP